MCHPLDYRGCSGNGGCLSFGTGHQFRLCFRHVRIAGVISDFSFPQAVDLELGPLHEIVGQNNDGYRLPGLDIRQILALFVQQKVGHFRRNLDDDLAAEFLHGFLFHQAKDG